MSSSFTVEALAGLASTEDFSTVTLRNVTESSILTNKLQPYKDVMLILVKGRRYVQVRLVEPVAESINSGDNYILVTKSEVCVCGAGGGCKTYYAMLSRQFFRQHSSNENYISIIGYY